MTAPTPDDAERLAIERHRIAADNPFSPVPPWEHLTDHERKMSILHAANYLKVLGAIGWRPVADVLREAAADLLACHYERSRVDVATFAEWLRLRAGLGEHAGEGGKCNG